MAADTCEKCFSCASASALLLCAHDHTVEAPKAKPPISAMAAIRPITLHSSVGTRALGSGEVPLATICPWFTITMWRARRSGSSM